MTLHVGRGKFQQNSILRPANNGMAMVAKNRVQQAVGWQNARHTEALKVDGVDLQIWSKHFCGQKCTCSMRNNGEELPPIFENGMNDENPFSTATLKTEWNTKPDQQHSTPESEFNGIEDFKESELTIDDIEEYAIGSNNSLIFGGDKSPCGICYGTGYKEGYQLFNGKRYVLDYWDNPETFGFMLQRTYPYSYEADFSSDNYIIWKFKAPTFFKEYLGIRVRNNVEYCRNYSLYVSFDGSSWLKYDDSLIKDRNGKQTEIYLKICPYTMPGANNVKFSVSHIEVFYQLGEFIKGDFEPITETENFELFEALQTTKLELAGDVSYIGREDVICEGKQGQLWKVISVTPHMTSDRQIFKNELELRLVQNSENLSLLKLINEPFRILNYRGLEQKQDMQTYDGEVLGHSVKPII